MVRGNITKIRIACMQSLLLFFRDCSAKIFQGSVRKQTNYNENLGYSCIDEKHLITFDLTFPHKINSEPVLMKS